MWFGDNGSSDGGGVGLDVPKVGLEGGDGAMEASLEVPVKIFLPLKSYCLAADLTKNPVITLHSVATIVGMWFCERGEQLRCSHDGSSYLIL